MKRSRAEEEALKLLYPGPGDRRAELYQNAEPPLQQELDWIQSWWDRYSRHTILSFYELGKRLKAVRDEVEKRAGGRYGVHAIETIEEYFGWDEGYIRRALALAEAFTDEEIKEYAGQRTEDGEPVSVGHLLILARVAGREQRRELLARTVAEGWRREDLNDTKLR